MSWTYCPVCEQSWSTEQGVKGDTPCGCPLLAADDEVMAAIAVLVDRGVDRSMFERLLAVTARIPTPSEERK